MKRESKIRPGWESCGPHGETCTHATKGAHGQHGDEWYYAVSDGEAALSLCAMTCFRKGELALEPFQNERPSTGSNLALHTTYATSRGEVLMQKQSCGYLGECYCEHSWGLLAGDFWKEHTSTDTFEQPEPFWIALEAKFIELKAAYPRTDLVRCNHCDGVGVVTR